MAKPSPSNSRWQAAHTGSSEWATNFSRPVMSAVANLRVEGGRRAVGGRGHRGAQDLLAEVAAAVDRGAVPSGSAWPAMKPRQGQDARGARPG